MKKDKSGEGSCNNCCSILWLYKTRTETHKNTHSQCWTFRRFYHRCAKFFFCPLYLSLFARVLSLCLFRKVWQPLLSSPPDLL
jgi:hypothetical protein